MARGFPQDNHHRRLPKANPYLLHAWSRLQPLQPLQPFSRRSCAGAAQEQLQESLSSSQIDSDNPSMQANDAWIPHPFPRSLGSVQAFHLRVPSLFLIPPCAAKLSKLQ